MDSYLHTRKTKALYKIITKLTSTTPLYVDALEENKRNFVADLSKNLPIFKIAPRPPYLRYKGGPFFFRDPGSTEVMRYHCCNEFSRDISVIFQVVCYRINMLIFVINMFIIPKYYTIIYMSKLNNVLPFGNMGIGRPWNLISPQVLCSLQWLCPTHITGPWFCCFPGSGIWYEHGILNQPCFIKHTSNSSVWFLQFLQDIPDLDIVSQIILKVACWGVSILWVWSVQSNWMLGNMGVTPPQKGDPNILHLVP